MNTTLTLIDPQSGKRVYIKTTAELPQRCSLCGAQLQGTPIASMEDRDGWVCLPHLERLLMTAEVSAVFKARAKVKAQLIDSNPGDITTVTQSMLVALEAW